MPPEMDSDVFYKTRKQQIYVGKNGFDFSQYDAIFKLSRPVVPHEIVGTNGDTKKSEKFTPLCGD